jgi:hypothetical protein
MTKQEQIPPDTEYGKTGTDTIFCGTSEFSDFRHFTGKLNRKLTTMDLKAPKDLVLTYFS